MIHSFTFLRNFLGAAKEHHLVEEEILRQLQHYLEPQYIAALQKKPNLLRYLQKNFFSTLFLAVYRALGIPAERRIFYGVINHCLRGIVTGTDNILDNEYKEMLPLAFPAEAYRFKSVMHILLFDRFLFQYPLEHRELFSAGIADILLLQKKLLGALMPIGAGEAREELGIEQILSPEEILQSVHMYKGGKLLCLAFVAPSVLEQQRSARLAVAEAGIFSIGLALQIIDDLTDFYEDIVAHNHNYLVSVIEYEGEEQEKTLLHQSMASRSSVGPAVEEGYTASLTLAMERAIGEALHGFDLLAEAGFWLDRAEATLLIRQLFKLRGVGRLLPFFPHNTATAARLCGNPRTTDFRVLQPIVAGNVLRNP